MAKKPKVKVKSGKKQEEHDHKAMAGKVPFKKPKDK